MAEWCRNDHCSDPATACGDLMEDVEAAQSLASEFPDKVRLVRYEDLSLDTLNTVKKILSFLKLPWHSSVQTYIASHTKPVPTPRKVRGKISSSSASDPYSTVRNSTATVMSWVEKMSSSNVTSVQDSCSSPMKALGYKPLDSSNKASVQLEDILVTGDKWRLQRPISQIKSEWQQRTEKVQDYCSKHKLVIPKPPELNDENISQKERDQIKTDYEDLLTYNIVHISGLGLNWCMVPKVASSSMSVLILPYLKKLNVNMKFPYTHLEVWTRAGRLSYSDFVQQRKEGIPSFLITRHPFARIVSAYKNKIENRTKFPDGNAVYDNWSRQMIKLVLVMF